MLLLALLAGSFTNAACISSPGFEGCATGQAVAQAAATSQLRPGLCELLYGQTGLLYACLHLEGALGPACMDLSLVRQGLVGQIVAAGRQAALAGGEEHQRFGLMFAWHDSNYLGGQSPDSAPAGTVDLCSI